MQIMSDKTVKIEREAKILGKTNLTD